MNISDTINIIGDSSCDLTTEQKAELGVTDVIPFFLNISGEQIVDDDTMNVGDLLAKMKSATTKMTSACPSPSLWKDAFIKAGCGIAVTLSAKLSGMYQSAAQGLAMAKEEVATLKGHIVDSAAAACGEALIIMKIREFANECRTFEEVAEKADHFARQMKTFFVLDNVSNLVKNGRMNKITGTLINALGIKPLLGAKEGEIEFYGTVRGTRNIADRMLDAVAKCGRAIHGDTLVISHCRNKTLAEEVIEKAKARFDFGATHILETNGLSSFYACEKGVIMSF